MKKSSLQLVIRYLAMATIVAILFFIFFMSAANGQSSQSLSYRFALWIIETVQSSFNINWTPAEVSRLAIDVQSFVRKGAHITEFFVLCAASLVVAWSFKRPTLRVGLCILAACIFVAITDELHQSFVPGRHGSASDVLVDCIGFAIAFAINQCVLRFSRS